MKRILIFNDSMTYGGTETMLLNVLKRLSGKDCEVTLLLPYPSGKDILLNEVPDNVAVEYIYPQPLSRKRKIVYENLMNFFPRYHNRKVGLDLSPYDLIVSFKDSIFSIIFSREPQRKILWIHNLPTRYKYGINSLKEYIPVKLLKTRINRLIRSYRKYNDVICVSNACKERYTDIFNYGRTYDQQLTVLYNALDMNRVGEKASGQAKLKLSSPVFISVTRFSIEKGVDRIVEASNRLKSEGYDFRVVIVGDGELTQEIRNKIEKQSLNEVITLTGYMPNPYPEIKESDWLICSSHKESFSLVLIESIFLRTPVITTDCGGPTEIVDNGKYGILIPNSTEGVYEGMKKSLDNPELSQEFQSKAAECLERFDYNKWLLSVDEIFGV